MGIVVYFPAVAPPLAIEGWGLTCEATGAAMRGRRDVKRTERRELGDEVACFAEGKLYDDMDVKVRRRRKMLRATLLIMIGRGVVGACEELVRN